MGGLQTFHLIMYPRPHFTLPILYLDVVADQNWFRFAIIDASSIRWDKSLPDFFVEAVKQIKSFFFVPRCLTENGYDNLFPFSLSVKPVKIENANRFINFTCSFFTLQLEIACFINP